MADKNDEQILVVKSDIIFGKGKWQGLKTDNLDYYIDLINKNYEFKRRGDVENDPSYQQIIPYILFSCQDKFFAYKYIKNAGEARLINDDYQLGVGGHINKGDVQSADVLEQGMIREWEEEVDFKGLFLQKKLVGILKDDSRPVEQVHLGLVYHFIGEDCEISCREVDKMEGKLFPLNEILKNVAHSPWMKIVCEQYLNKGNMLKNSCPGKFYVFEGIDGCGKATQTKLLADYYKSKGFEVEKIDFPQHGQRSSAMVDDYLTGKYGDVKSVSAEVASIFYATDRYDASFKIKKWLEEGKIVIADRYLVSNIGHQGGKIIEDKSKWGKYVRWLYDLEYNTFKIPKPDYTFILKTSVDFSLQLANKITDEEKAEKRKSYLGDDKKQDIHEKDSNHLKNALDSYLMVAQEYPNDFKVIECLENGQLLSPEIISQKVVEAIEDKPEKIINNKELNIKNMAKILQNAGSYKILAIMLGVNGENPLQLIETAGRTAYQSRDKINDESALKFAKALRVRGHESVFEHSCMTVEFNDVSRGLTHELVRHRIAAFTQESTRYVDEKEFKVVAPPNKDFEEKLVELTLPGSENNGLKVSLKVSFKDWVEMNEQMYKGLRQAGWVPQDARQILPTGIESQIVITCNLREWRHIFKMRCAIDAHWEIREVMVKLLKDVQQRIPILFDDFEISADGQSAILVKPQF